MPQVFAVGKTVRMMSKRQAYPIKSLADAVEMTQTDVIPLCRRM